VTKKIDIQDYPEVYSLDESLAILDKYKNDLTIEQFNNIRSTIHNFAIENMFANERDIIDCVKIQKGVKTAAELIVQYKKIWGV